MDQASWAVLRHIWKHNTNLTVICSFRTFGAQNVNYESEAVSCKYPTDSKEGEINFENELTNSFVDSTSEENRLLVIELQALDEKSTLDLASRLVNEHDACVPNDNKMLEAVYKLSGGNPLYAVEVSKAAIKMVGKIESPKLLIKMAVRDSAESKFDCIDDSKKDDVIQKWAKAFQKVTASLRSERIEEVIIFRFDQLNYKSQLLLKIAAVAGFNNAPFNADVLCFILPDFSSARTQDELFNSRASMYEDSNDESDVEDQDFLSDFTQRISDEHRGESCERDYRCRAAVRKALNQILRESEFIRICKSVNESFEDGFETDHTGNDVSSRKMIESTDSMESYEFTSSLVQATILNLNLRDQNSMLHRQTATYLERQLLLKIAAATAGVSVPVVAGGVTASSGTLNSTVAGTDMSSLSSISTVSAGTVSSAQW